MLVSRIIVLSLIAATLLACGQKGPLVLPEAQHPRKKVTLPKTPTAPTTSEPPQTSSPSPSAPQR